MSQRNVRWGLCVSVLLGVPVACGGGSDPSPQNSGGSSGSNAGAGALAGAAHAGQPTTAGAAGEANHAGAGGAAVAGSANGGQTATGGGGASPAGASNGGAGASSAGASSAGASSAGASSAGASNGGGGTSSAGASNGGGGASSAGASNGGGGASSAGASNGGGGASSAGASNGGGGQGGSAAGSGGTGGAPQIGCALPTILDDMEDGNDGICPHPVRKGGWFVANSGGGVTTTPAASSLFSAYSLANDPHGTSQYGMHLIGGGFSSPAVWATLGASVATTGAYDASAYTAVSFSAKSHTGALVVRFNLSTTESRSVANGGTCVPTSSTSPCDDAYGTFITIDNTWQQYQIVFANTGQAGWGTVVTRNMAHLVTVEFNYTQKPQSNVTNPSSFEFLVDDLQFN